MNRRLDPNAPAARSAGLRNALTGLVCAGLIAVVQSAAAEAAATGAADNWYLSFGLGANYGERAKLDGPDIKMDYDLGLPRYSGGVGRRFGERWWLDLALSERKTKGEFFYPGSVGPSGDPGPNDRYSGASLMLSAIREFQLGPWLKPYVGFGLGPTWLTYQLGEVQPGSPDETYRIDDDTTALALRGVAGFRFPLTRTLDLGLEYEYWRTPDVNLQDLDGNDVNLDQTIQSGWLTLNWYPGSERAAAFGAPRATGDAGHGFYLTGSLGVAWTRDSDTGVVTFDAFAPGGLVTMALGHTLGRRWRVEAEYAYRTTNAELLDFGNALGERRVRGHLRSSSIGANLWYDLLPNAAIRPTLGIGAGAARLDYGMDNLDGTPFVDDKVNTSYLQLAAGFDIELARQLTLHTAWRVWYADQHDIDFADGQTGSADQWVHSVELGLRYQLGR